MNRKHALAAVALGGLALTAMSTDYAWSAPLLRTNAGTQITSQCADGRWRVAMSVTSQTDTTIHVALVDNHGGTGPMELAPHATKTITEYPDAGSNTWTWTWTSSDGHLVGPAISGTVTRPATCGVATSTTVASPTTTTCAQAIPPRTDCNPSTTEVTTSPTTVPDTTPTSATTVDSSRSSVPTVDTAVVHSETSIVRTSSPRSTLAIGTLPPTGTASPLAPIAAAVALLLIGGGIVTATRKGG